MIFWFATSSEYGIAYLGLLLANLDTLFSLGKHKEYA